MKLSRADRFRAAKSFTRVEQAHELAMNPKLDKLEGIFDRARQLGSRVAQAAYLAMACAGDEELRKQVETMLKDESGAKDFFESNAEVRDGDAPRGLDGAKGVSGSNLEREGPGTLIDRYKLLEKIGEGAMGVVYMAEQEEPVRRRVALKIIKLGMDTKEVVARFEAERQALALMDHPNIARVLDGGATETGRPYFVMELVQGVRITEFCDKNRLSEEERLKLFLPVCEAIQSAHQKGIIHRDIKPTNILVTLNPQGTGMPKVIDFGVAKAINQKLTEKTLFTRYGTIIGTPAYMSPEQAEMSNLDVDTRADIYGLGVVLYELLTGTTPFPEERLRSAGYNEMRRIISHEEPERPSTRLSTLQGEQRSVVARNRGLSELTLGRALPGDLDWIVMKCLEKDRTRRYATANGVATDIQRHLQSEPVMARPPSRLYRFQKTVRRNRLAFAAAAAVVVALIAGLGLSTWLYLRERAARQRAVVAERSASTEAGKSAQVAQFLADMLRSVSPSVAHGEDTKLLRQILDDTARRLSQDLKDQPDIEADLRSILGSVYVGLGDYASAAAMHRKALDIRTSLFGRMDLKVSDSLSDLGDIAWRQGHYSEAEKYQTQALGMRRSLLGSESAKLADSLDGLGKVRWHAGKWPEAESLFRQALAMCRKLLGNTHADTVRCLDDLAGLLSAEDKFADAEPIQREALGLNRQLRGTDDPAVAVSLNNLSDTLDAEGKLAESESLAREALALRKKVLGAEHPDYAHSLFQLGNVLRDEGRLAEAEAMYRESLAIRRHDFGETNLEVAGSLNNLGAVLVNENRLAEAEPLIREALGIQRALLPADHQDIAGSLLNLAATLAQEGKLGNAETAQREALAMQQRLLGQHLNIAISFYNLAFLLEADGKLAEAETNAAESLALRQKLLGNEHSDVATTMALLARIRSEQHNFEGAEALQRLEVGMWRKLLANNSPPLPINVAGLADSLARFTDTLMAREKFAEAELTAREGVAFTEKELPENWQRYRARSLLGGVLVSEHKLIEAEPLLLTGYDHLARLAETIPLDDKPAITEAIQRLVSYYQAAGQPEKAAEWKKELGEQQQKR